jgi:predicted PurR-regulated permease PerM
VADHKTFKERMARWRANGLPIGERGRPDQGKSPERVTVPADDSIDVGGDVPTSGGPAGGDVAPGGSMRGGPALPLDDGPTPSTAAGADSLHATSMPVPPETIVAVHTGDSGTGVAPVVATDTSEFDRAVPRGLQIAASWSWRVIVIAIMVYGLSLAVRYVSEVVIPVGVAILLAAMIGPLTNRLTRWGLPRGAAAGISVLGGVLLIGGVLTLIGTQIAGQASSLGSNVVSGFNTFVEWLQNGPLHVSSSWFNLDEWGKRVQSFLADSQGTITTYASEFGSQLGHFLAGIAIVLFSLFYFLYQGRTIFRFLLKFVPHAARDRVDHAARGGWTSLSHYVRAVILVALVDAIGVLIGALILGVPLAPALAALVFIGAFVPIVGAFVSGCVAVLVALVALGWVKALIMLAIIIGVMQLEGHVLQPFLLGRAVKLHPLAVILAIAIGVIMAGIVGALMAVPLLAYVKTFVQDLNESAETGLRPAGREFR